MGDALRDLVLETGSLEEWAHRARSAETQNRLLRTERDAVNERHAHAVQRLSTLRNEMADLASAEALIRRARGSRDPVVVALTGAQIEAVVRAALAPDREEGGERER